VTDLPHRGPRTRDELIEDLVSLAEDLRTEPGRTDKRFVVNTIERMHGLLDDLRPFTEAERVHLRGMGFTKP
jgi:hypothetical protein